MVRCSVCGKQIRFIYSKKERAKIPVNAQTHFFVPPNGVEKEELFINASGVEIKGCRRPLDGMIGYRRHECIE